MEFRYYTEDENKQPQGQQPLFFQIPGHHQPAPPPQENITLNEEQKNVLIGGRLRNVFSQARTLETKVLLDGMGEIRSALQQPVINSGDTGSTERPPLTPAFSEDNRDKLQNAYLMMVERYVNYCDHFLMKELKVETTNEIKKI